MYFLLSLDLFQNAEVVGQREMDISEGESSDTDEQEKDSGE